MAEAERNAETEHRAAGDRLGLIGVPTDVGAADRGACMAPQALRIAGLERTLQALGHGVTDHGDLSGPENPEAMPQNGFRHLHEVSAWCDLLRGAIKGLLGQGEVPVILGGDHSISIGSIAGVADHCAELGRPLSVVWLDAHADFNTPLTSPSGNIHGMPLAALCGRILADQIRIGQSGPVIDPTKVHLIGIRSVDSIEKREIVRCGVNVYDMRTIDEQGMAAVLRQVVEAVAATGGHVHVSFDVDFLDPAVAPGVGTTVAGGATFREAHLCMEMMHETGLLGSLDLVELNPFLDVRGRTAQVMVELTASAFGKVIVDRANRSGAH